MIFRKISNFDPEQICDSGQCFRWNKEGDGSVSLIAFGKKLIIKKEEEGFSFSATDKEWDEIWADYFDLNTDYGCIGDKIERFGDSHLKECYKAGSGIRILKQDIWETVVSFIISQNNNIPRIRGSIEKLCSYCDLPAEGGGFRFPEPSEIPLEVFDDKTMGFGYRAEYLKELCVFTLENPNWLDGLEKMDYNIALGALLERKGIGKKVANCICLFGLHMIGAFPVDTHVKQLMDEYYPKGLDLTPYEGCGGVIQQYLFYAELKRKDKK